MQHAAAAIWAPAGLLGVCTQQPRQRLHPPPPPLKPYRPRGRCHSAGRFPCPLQGCTTKCDWKKVQDTVPGCAYKSLRTIFDVRLGSAAWLSRACRTCV